MAIWILANVQAANVQAQCRAWGRQINLTGLGPVFRGSDAVRAGALRQGKLRDSAVRRLFQGVYSQASVAQTHELYCTAAGLALPPSAVITGRSAATLRGVALARPQDPVEALVPLEARVVRGSGLAVHRTAVDRDDWVSWSGLRLATPQRMALDLLLGRSLPDAVADLNAVLRGRLVALPEVYWNLSSISRASWPPIGTDWR
jgi:hypothetical protein